MSRWSLVAVLSMLPALGCASTSQVRAGLANAQPLGTMPSSEEHVTDVVANGDDGCEAVAQTEQGTVLRSRQPPCASWSPGEPLTREVRPSVPVSTSGLAGPWLNHLYFGWPCPPALSERQVKSFVPEATTVASCSVP